MSGCGAILHVVIEVAVDGATLARTRIIPSPASELTAWLWLAAADRRHPVYGDPGPAARHALGHRDVALVASVLPTRASTYQPDLLTPQPTNSPSSFDGQLEEVAGTPQLQARRQVEVRARLGGTLPAATLVAAESGTFATRAANGLRLFWRATMADQWPRLRALLDTDIAIRSSALAKDGWGSVLNALHPDLGWDGACVRIAKPFEESVALADEEFVLAPTALGWPRLSVSHAAQAVTPGDSQTLLCYPALGIGAAGRVAPAAALGALLGPTRARLLADLGAPRTNGELSRRHHLTPSTVSHHLAVLRRAGLVTRRRLGRASHYQRTDSGDRLAASA